MNRDDWKALLADCSVPELVEQLELLEEELDARGCSEIAVIIARGRSELRAWYDLLFPSRRL